MYGDPAVMHATPTCALRTLPSREAAVGMSLPYEVLEPLPDAMSALRRARELLGGFAEWADDPFSPEVGPVVTAEQFHHARHCFT